MTLPASSWNGVAAASTISMTRLLFSSATLKAIHWPYRMIAMKIAIESPNPMKNEVVASFGSWGPAGTSAGSAGTTENSGGLNSVAWSSGGTPARVSRSWIVIAIAAWRMSWLRRESPPSFE